METSYTIIDEYITTLRIDEMNFKGGIGNQEKALKDSKNIGKKFVINFFNIFKSLFDFILLKIYLLSHSYKEKKVVYTAYNFCNLVNGKYEDRIVKPLFWENILFLNTSKEIHLNKINDQKVYNIGGLAKLISLIFYGDSYQMRYFKAYQILNNSIIKSLPDQKEIYMLWFYDLNSLSIIFSKYRSKIKLIEIQHGSIINYPPYGKPSPVKVADVFYVKNQPTIEYLKEHICKSFDCEYLLLPYPKGNRRKLNGIHILYASTVDFKGVHPVFLKFLNTTKLRDLFVQVRLHPRERTPEIEDLFTGQINSCGIKFTFDKSKNWLEENEIENLIVVSPWSSSIEDAYDNGYKTIIIDPAGKQRFVHLIDNKNCFYSEDLEDILLQITQN